MECLPQNPQERQLIVDQLVFRQLSEIFSAVQKPSIIIEGFYRRTHFTSAFIPHLCLVVLVKLPGSFIAGNSTYNRNEYVLVHWEQLGIAREISYFADYYVLKTKIGQLNTCQTAAYSCANYHPPPLARLLVVGGGPRLWELPPAPGRLNQFVHSEN